MIAAPSQGTSAFFSYHVNSFLDLLCHELVLSTTHLLAGCFLRFMIFSVSFLTSPFFLLYGKCGTYPLFAIACSSGSELYALSRHRCCSFLFLPSFVLAYGIRLLAPAQQSIITSSPSTIIFDRIIDYFDRFIDQNDRI